MNFEASIVKTKNWRRSPYGVISLILFVISVIVLFVLSSKEIFGTDYLAEWFEPGKKPFLILTLLFNLNAVVLIFLDIHFGYKVIGNVLMTGEKIIIKQPSESLVYNTQEIAAIRLYYFGYKSYWKSWGRGNQNFITVVDKQDNESAFEFFLSSHADKKSMIDQLLSFQKQGVKIRLDYLNPPNASYPYDTDFVELKIQEKYPNKQVPEMP